VRLHQTPADERYRQFLDASGNALTLIFCFTDIPANGGGTCLNEDGIKRELPP
jgi:hypothetical protein